MGIEEFIVKFAPMIIAFVKAGIEEIPIILDMCARKRAGTDPWAAIAQERVEQIAPDVRLDLDMRIAEAVLADRPGR